MTVTASYRWLDSSGKDLHISGTRAFLSKKELDAGGTDNLTLNVSAPPAPGSYILAVTMLQEGVASFDDKGGKQLRVPVTVQ